MLLVSFGHRGSLLLTVRPPVCSAGNTRAGEKEGENATERICTPLNSMGDTPQ